MLITTSMSDHNKLLARMLITPSIISGTIDVVAGVGLVITTIVVSSFRSSSLQKELFDYQTNNLTSDLSNNSQIVAHGLNSNTFVSNLPLLLFWGLVGTVIYMLVLSLARALKGAVQLHDEMEFVHANQTSLIRTALIEFLIRVVVLVFWVIYISFFFHRLIPYCLAAAHAASAVGFFTLNGLLYAILAFIVVVIAVHVHTIFLRLLLLKPRIFTKAYYLD